jgi:poly(glycerol-phosphate) alpha-glucosyltransferase
MQTTTVSVYTASISRRAGGLFEAMRGLYVNPAFRDNNINIRLYAYKDEATEQDLPAWEDLPIHLFRSQPFLYSVQARNAILQSETDILHVHGLWRYPHAFMDTWKKRTGKPVIVTPHGMLDPYIIQQQGKIKQCLGKALFARRAFNAAGCYHALCKQELEDIRAYGLTQPIAIIPNGINLPNEMPKYSRTDAKKHLLYLGRLHQKKGLDLLLEAFAAIKMEKPEIIKDWIVDIVGWDHEGFLRKLQQIVQKHQLEKHIVFHGGVFGKDKERMYATSDAYILPSHGEGLPMTVLEAWAYRLPVVMTPFCNLPEGFEHEAAIRINDNIPSIKEGLMQLCTMTDEERIRMGIRGYQLAAQEFTWNASAEKMKQLYQWILEEGEKPEFVYE